MPRPDSSVVERGPEKAGVGGSIPSLATTFSTTYNSVSPRFHSNSFQLVQRDSPRLRRGLTGFFSSVVVINPSPSFLLPHLICGLAIQSKKSVYAGPPALFRWAGF